jgi:hypothetical protein
MFVVLGALYELSVSSGLLSVTLVELMRGRCALSNSSAAACVSVAFMTKAGALQSQKTAFL